MSRQRRGDPAPGIYHITARGNRRQLIFIDVEDFEGFFAIAAKVVDRLDWAVYGYCLMPNHFHLVVRTRDESLSGGMHRLNSRYAHWFNERHGLDGHLFQSRYHSVRVETDAHLIELVRYVALNPVRAGLCLDPGGWPWSSFRELTVGGEPQLVTLDEALAYFGEQKQRARELYRQFVCA